MINESLLKNYNIGKDGFIWWLGQVCEAKTWEHNYPCLPVNSQKDLPGFKRRVKVSILGWHTSDKKELKSEELPWAYCLLPVTAGGGTGGASESLNFTGGEWVFGFFLDGEDGQQPVIIGVLDKSTQNDWRDTVPDARYVPFSGFSNKRVAPLTDMKKDGTVEKQPVGDANVKVGDTGVQRTKTQAKETVRLERGSSEDVRPKASATRNDNLVATGDMTAADNSTDRNPFGNTDKVMKRLSRIETFVKKHNGIEIDGSTNKLFAKSMEREQKRAARIIATDQKDRTEKIRAAALEASSKMMSNVATFGKIVDMAKVKNANKDAASNIIDTFNQQISKLPLNAGDFIKQSANKIVSQPPCVTEAYTGGLIGNTIANLDSTMNNLMGPVNNIMTGISGGAFPPDPAALASGLMSQGLGAFGGISINLDGIANFSTSYKKLMRGEMPTPPTKVKDLTALGGALADIPSEVKDGNILEDIAAAIPSSGSLVAGNTNFLNKNSIFSTAISTDNLNMRTLGGLGAITDTLNLARNLPGIQSMPGSTGMSVLNIAKARLEGGETLDAAVLAANVVFPGGGDIVKQAFESQIQNTRVAGGSCSTGPTANGPPQIKIFGGNGNGATANAVVGPNGNILAVEVTRGGKGFTEIPFAVVYDNSGRGKGAVVKCELDYDNPVVDVVTTSTSGATGASGTASEITITSYPIKDIDVLEPGSGYMQKPDGSIGGNGRTYAEANATLIKDKQGNYYQFEPGTGIKVPPGGTVYLPAGTTCSLPTSAIKTNGEPLVDPKGSNIVDYAAIRLMHNFDFRGGFKIIPGPQGADRSAGDNGFGAGDDLRRAREEGFKDSDIRFYLEGDPSRGQQSWFLKHGRGKIGRNMQRLLDNPAWGPLPIMNSGGKKPGKIKSLQINVKKGYKGFAKVTDGSRLGAGPILSLRDAVTDRKISNILEFQTGNWLNQKADLEGNTEILQLFRDQELRAVNGTPIEEFGRFGTAGKQTWEQTKLGAEGSLISLDKTNKNYRGEQEWVRKWYIENLCREPDKGGMEHWLDHLREGKTREEVSAMMKVATGEYAEVQAKRASGKISPERCQWKGRVLGGGVRKDINGKNWRTLDPWRANFPDGTRLTFRGVYNHNTGLSAEQLADPYNLQKNNYRYFIFDYEVEVYSTPTGFNYTLGVDTLKNKWYKLIDIKYVTGTEDWFNGETVKKRCLDKAGRLYEMYITICTYDDETTDAIGAGLATNSEVQEVIRTPLPCTPEIIRDDYADYQRVRWYRENIKGGIPDKNGDKYGENWGHIPGTERNELVRQIVKVYNSFGDKGWAYKYGKAGTQGRMYADKPGLHNWINDYFKWLGKLKEGVTCETETILIPQKVAGYNGPGVYLDLRGVSGPQTITFREVIDDSGIHHALEIPGVASVSEQGLNWGSTAKVVNNILGGRIYGPITSATAAGVWVGTENPPHIKKNDLPTNLRTNKVVMLEEMSDDFDDFGLSTNVGKYTRFDTAPVGGPPKKKKVPKTTIPLTEEEYESYRYNLNQKPEPRAFACVKKFMNEAAKEHFDNEGKVWKELTYCDWAREYVEEIRSTFRETTTIGYDLPCGGEITAPSETPTDPPTDTTPKIVKPKQTKINNTGSGYGAGDKITIGGKEVPFEIDPDGRIVSVGVPNIPVIDFPEVEIETEFGAGADIEVSLMVEDVPDDPELLPLDIVEVVDCVGKNIFIKES